MSRKIFYENQYQKECISAINSISTVEDKILVVLEDSIFYPEGGGQPCDLGLIDDARIIKVFEKDGIIYNQLSSEPKNSNVNCKVDFERRYDFMQQHTGEHLLSAAFLKKFNGVNKGFHLGDEYTTIDIDLSDITNEMEEEVEFEANSYIFRNIPVDSYFVNRNQAETLPLRSNIKVNDDLIRIVNIEGIDMCACCGTHLKHTGEVGMIKIIKIEHHKGMSRVYFKCGNRALKDYRRKNDIITSLIKITASEENKLNDKFISQNNKIIELTKKLNICKKKAAQTEADKLLMFTDEIIYKEYENIDFEELQMISEEVTKKNKCFIGVSEQDKKITAAHNGYSEIDFGTMFKNHIKEYSGKGGGDSKKAQGTFNNIDELKKFSDLVIKKATGIL
ncbi:MAG: alanyl-tRNA editing protein [Solirubrobacterales bacterium]